MQSVCIDGYNLALSAGTGIATYGRNLLFAARTNGFETQILYGPQRLSHEHPLANEAEISAPSNPARLKPSERVVRAWNARADARGRAVHSLRPGGDVIWPDGAPADALWGAKDLYGRAHRSFRKYRVFTPVTFRPGAAKAPTIMHWTTPLPLFAKGMANVYTIHDLIPIRLPRTTLHNREAFLKLHERAARHSDLIVTVSEATRRDVIQILKLSPEKVVNTYQAVTLPQEAADRSDDEAANEIERVFDLTWKQYFLHFGNIEPKKNLGRLTEAYLASGSQTPLVVVGSPGWLDKPETALIEQIQRERHPASERIRRFEYTSRSLMVSLIRGAKAVLFPSLYEGFGLPVLEAMTLSTAVLTSNAGALAEVAGDAAMTVDPYDTRSIAAGIRALDSDGELVAELERRGVAQAATFSPERYRRSLAAAYARLAT